VALVLVALGAFNNDLLFDVDLVVGTWTAVSLFWVAVVTAGVVVVTGLAAAYLARSSAVTTRRKLEKELQGTYERLRDAEAKVPAPAPAQAAVEVTPGEQTAVTGVVSAAAPEAESVVEAAAPADDETAVISAPPEAETVVAAEAPPADVADASPADVADASPPAAS
jgi:CHASE1-domain containing sensor protein